jgi:hypothetical protein
VITVPKSDQYDPGTWKLLSLPEGKKSATFTCPNRHTGSLEDHEILADGSVHPSVLCTFDGCGFHEFIKLEGWSS